MPPIGPEAAAVWYADVPEPSAPVFEPLRSLLSPEERDRAGRFVLDADRCSYVAAHALLRRCLEAASGRSDWSFRIDQFGKPELDGPSGAPPLRFNLTHTAGLVACALCRAHDIGVDAEALARDIDFRNLAARWFADAEHRRIAGADDLQVGRAFFETWTLKEAVIKALGRGLALPLQDFSVALDPLSVTFDPSLSQDAAQWRLDHRALPGHQMAVALRGRGVHRTRLSWRRMELARLL